MRLKVLLSLLIFSALILNGQEINLHSSGIATSGIHPTVGMVNISNWKLGEVHVIVLEKNDMEALPEIAWNVSCYPNPFNTYLDLEFQMEKTAEFSIQITDISGKNLLYEKDETILPGQSVRLDLDHLPSAVYLVTVLPEDRKSQRMVKIHKH